MEYQQQSNLQQSAPLTADQKMAYSQQPAAYPSTLNQDQSLADKETKHGHGLGAKISNTVHKVTGVFHHHKEDPSQNHLQGSSLPNSTYQGSSLPNSTYQGSTLPASTYTQGSTLPASTYTQGSTLPASTLPATTVVNNLPGSITSQVTELKSTPIITTEERVIPAHQIPVQTTKIIPEKQIEVQSMKVIPEKQVPVTVMKTIPEQRIPVMETKIIPEKRIPVTEYKVVPEQVINLGTRKDLQEITTTTTTETRTVETPAHVIGQQTLPIQQTLPARQNNLLQQSSLPQPRTETSTFVGPTSVSQSAVPPHNLNNGSRLN